MCEGVWGPLTQKRARCICPLARLGVRAIFHPSSFDWSLHKCFCRVGRGSLRWTENAGSSAKANAFGRVSRRTLLFGVMRRVVVRRGRLVGAQFVAARGACHPEICSVIWGQRPLWECAAFDAGAASTVA